MVKKISILIISSLIFIVTACNDTSSTISKKCIQLPGTELVQDCAY
jgi:hypothetical protein